MIENGSRVKGKKGKSHITAFYIETLLLVAAFLLVILTLTRVFAWSGRLGKRAALLTQAVHLAENAAEMVASSHSLEELASLLDEGGNAELLSGTGQERRFLRVRYDEKMRPVADGQIRMDISWVPEESSGWQYLVTSTVAVYRDEEEEPLYALDTAVCIFGP